jgi:glycerol-3-phosphate dehydrogenase
MAMRWERRKAQWESVERTVFDVAVIGGGINGASVYRALCRQGYRALLVDRADFAAGTSQASAMFIWGGLLYLRNLDLGAIMRFCRARDAMVRDMAELVQVCPIRYVPTRDDARGPAFILAGLTLYWLLGAFRRSRPRVEAAYPERGLFTAERLRPSLVYEEARVFPSDARLVLHWILAHQGPEQVAINYCGLQGGVYDWGAGAWRLELADGLGGRQAVARARLLVNAAGVWTDEINDRFGVTAPFKHVFGKGVFLGIPRDPRLTVPLIFETAEEKDCMTMIPWGPVALWGPTETLSADLNGSFRPEPADVDLLLREVNRHTAAPVGRGDVVSLRCGVRPLAVKRSFTPGRHTLGLSRNLHIAADRDVPWISVYGGKITGCVPAAEAVARLVRDRVPAAGTPPAPPANLALPAVETFPDLEAPVLSARHSAEREMCWTLEDYLRRRTNIAQWVARGGLGRRDEHLPRLQELALAFTDGDALKAQEAVDAYRKRVDREFDRVLAARDEPRG